MANEYNRSSSAHLQVNSANPAAKNLVRGNSVATLNQIYQHQNSIPVRNRILNTAKSLYNSIDKPTEVDAMSQSQLPVTSGQRYLKSEQFARAPPETGYQIAGGYQQALAAASQRAVFPQQQQQQQQQHLFGGSNSNLPHLYQISPQRQQQQQHLQMSTQVKIINVARRNKRNEQQDSNDSPSYSGSLAAAPPAGSLSMHQQHHPHRNRARSATMKPPSAQTHTSSASGSLGHSSRTGWSTDSSSSCSSSHGTSPLRNQTTLSSSPIFNAKPAASTRLLDTALEQQQQQQAPQKSLSPSRQPNVQSAPFTSVQSAHIEPAIDTTSTSPSRRAAAMSSAQVTRPARPALGQQQQQAPANTFGYQTQLNAANVKRHRKLPQIPVEPQQKASRAFTGRSMDVPAVAPQLMARGANKSLSSSSSASSNSASVASLSQQLNAGGQPYLQQQTLTGATIRQHNTLASGDQLRVLSFPMPAQQQVVAAPAGSVPLARASTLVNPPTQTFGAPAPATDTAADQAKRRNGRQTLAALVGVSRTRSSSGSADTASPRSPLPAGSGQSVAPAVARTRLSGSSSSSNSPLPASSHTNNRLSPSQVSSLAAPAQIGTNPVGAHNHTFSFECYEPAPSTQEQLHPPLVAGLASHQADSDRASCPSAGRGRRLSSCGSGLRANFLMNKQQAISEFTPPRSLESSISHGSSEHQHHFASSSGQVELERPATPSVYASSAGGAHWSTALLRGSNNTTATTSSTGGITGDTSDEQRSPGPGLGTGTGAGARFGGSALPMVSVALHLRRPSGAAGLPPRAASATESYSGEQSVHGAFAELAGDLSRLQPVARSMIAVRTSGEPSQTGGSLLAAPSSAASSIRNRLAATLGGFTSALSLDLYSGFGAEPPDQQQQQQQSLAAGSNNQSAAPFPRGQRTSLGLPEVARDRQPSNASTSSMPPAPRADSGSPRKFGAWAERIGAGSAAASDERFSAGAGGQLSSRDALRARSAGQLEAERPGGKAAERARNSASSSSSICSSDNDATNSSCSSASDSSLSLKGAGRKSPSRPGGRTKTIRARRRLSAAQRVLFAGKSAAAEEAARRTPVKVASSESDELTLSARLLMAERSANELFRKVDLSPQLTSQIGNSNASNNIATANNKQQSSVCVGDFEGPNPNVNANSSSSANPNPAPSLAANAFFSQLSELAAQANALSSSKQTANATRSRVGEQLEQALQQDYLASASAGGQNSTTVATSEFRDTDRALILFPRDEFTCNDNDSNADDDEQADDLSLFLRSVDKQRQQQHLSSQSAELNLRLSGQSVAAGALASSLAESADRGDRAARLTPGNNPTHINSAGGASKPVNRWGARSGVKTRQPESCDNNDNNNNNGDDCDHYDELDANKSRFKSAPAGNAIGRRAVKVVRRAITLRSFVKNFASRSASNELSPVRAQANDSPDTTCPHLVSVARADTSRCSGRLTVDCKEPPAGSNSLPRPFAGAEQAVRKLSGSLFGGGAAKAPRRAHSTLAAGHSPEAARSVDVQLDGPNSPVRRSVSLRQREHPLDNRDSTGDKASERRANSKRLDGMKNVITVVSRKLEALKKTRSKQDLSDKEQQQQQQHQPVRVGSKHNFAAAKSASTDTTTT